MKWKVTPLTWDGRPAGTVATVEASDKAGAELAYFARPDAVSGPVHTAPVKDRKSCDTKPCGCRRSGLTRARKLLTERGTIYSSYDTERGSYRDHAGVTRCVGCQAPQGA